MTRDSPSILCVNGRVYTAATLGASPASWLLSRADAVIATGHGTAPAVDCAVFDLGGRTLAPAFVDAHVHLAWLATALLGPDLSPCSSRDAVLEAVTDWRGPGRGQAGEWIVGTGFDETTWRDARLPSRAELDHIDARRPILLQRVCGHVGIANTAALAQGVAGPHTDPESGRVAEDDLYALNDHVRPSAAEFAAVLPDVAALLHRHGIVAVHDVSSPEMVEALARAGDLGVRVTCSIPARYLQAAAAARAATPAAFFAAHGLGNLPLGGAAAPFQVLGIKLFLDGSLGARTACLRHPYADAAETHGTALYESTALTALTRSAHAAGLQLMVHAIGDAALDQGLDVLAMLARDGNPLRHRVEHLEVTPPDLVERFARSGLWACMQPNFAARWSQPGGMNAQRLGERLQMCNLYRALHAAGIPIAFGSDCMPLGPLYGLQGAVAHPLPGQRLPMATAWALYTQSGHAIAGARAGTDFVLLDADPFTEPHADPGGLHIGGMIRGGRVAPGPVAGSAGRC